MILITLAALLTMTVQAEAPERPFSGQAVLIQTEVEPVIVTLDLDNSPEAGCAFIRGLVEQRGAVITPIGRGVQAVRAADGSTLGVFVETAGTTDAGKALRTGRLIDPALGDQEQGEIERDAVALTGQMSLMGPNPDQCGW